MQCYDWEATSTLSRMLLSVQKAQGSLLELLWVRWQCTHVCLLRSVLLLVLYTSYILCTKHQMCICNIMNSII